MPEEAQIETCEHCGGKLTGRWESLSPGLCQTLINFYQAARFKNGRWIAHLQNDCVFTKNQFANAQKLKYFDLLTKTETSGVWALTGIGLEFVRNRLGVWKKVYVFRNEVMQHSDDTVTIVEAMKCEPYWLKKPDYTPAPMADYRPQSLFE